MRDLSLLTFLAAVLLGCAGSAPEPEAGAEPSTPEAVVAAQTVAAAEAAAQALEYPEWETVPVGEHASYNQRASLIQRGHLVYAKYCVGCHGEYGDGKGAAAARLITQPRDFTSGIYKFRSTDSGSLPLETDLHRTITHGLSRVSMPAFPLMPEGDKVAVIEYVKSFYGRWDEEKAQRRVVPVPYPPEDLGDAGRILRGRVVYLLMGCAKCHGLDARGAGATQTEYVDAWGNPQKAFDFTRGALKGGNTPQDVYRTFHTGLRSIMPSFGGDTLALVTADVFASSTERLDPGEIETLRSVLEEFPADGAAVYSQMGESERLELAERNSWDLVAYILSLRTPTTTAAAVLGPDAAAAASSG